MATIEDWQKIEIRVGSIVRAEEFPKARKPAYKIWIDFGAEGGIKKTSAQITELYTPSSLVGLQVMAIVNFPPRQVADFISEVRLLGACTDAGVVLMHPAKTIENGTLID